MTTVSRSGRKNPALPISKAPRSCDRMILGRPVLPPDVGCLEVAGRTVGQGFVRQVGVGLPPDRDGDPSWDSLRIGADDE